jgi:hypothetical protein
MEMGPVELVLLTFPGTRADPAVVAATLAGAVRTAGGEVALHVQLPRETALDAASVS